MTRRILALLAALFLLAGCSTDNQTPESSQAPEQTESVNLEEMAQDAVEALAAGDTQPMHAMFADPVAAQLSEDALLSTWEETAAIAGEYVGTASVSSRESQGNTVISVRSEFTVRDVVADLTMDDDGLIQGLWFNYADIDPSDRPDSLTLPEGATEVDVTVGEHELPGLLTLPAEDGPDVVVLLVSGSGPNDMDGTVGGAGNAVLRDLTYQLADHGVPSLRYDKRFHAHPELGAEDVTIRDEVLDDVDAALELLASRDEVEGRAIIVAGHSLGGMLIPAIATQHPEVEGVISLAGTLRTLWDVVRDQYEADIETARDAGAMTDEEAQEAREILDEEIERANTMTDPSEPGVADAFTAAYVVSLNELRLVEAAAELEVPILVLHGNGDFQVLPDVDFDSWRPALAEHPDASFQIFEGLNHFFMPSVDAGDLTDYEIPSVVDPQVTDVIADWLAERWSSGT